MSREGLIKDAFELHFGTWQYTQRLLGTKTQNICLCCFSFDNVSLFVSHNFMEIQLYIAEVCNVNIKK